MRQVILTAVAALSLSAVASFAATPGQYGQGMPMNGTTPAVVAPTIPQSGSSDAIFTGAPNPWNGTESWSQWNKDHPQVGGG
jgi:hypothetical protein